MPSPEALPESESAAPLVVQDRRWRRRKSMLWAATIDCGGSRHKCQVLNLSASGAMLQLVVPLAVGQAVTVTFEGRGAIPAEVVWCLPDKIGVQFSENADRVASILGDIAP